MFDVDNLVNNLRKAHFSDVKLITFGELLDYL